MFAIIMTRLQEIRINYGSSAKWRDDPKLFYSIATSEDYDSVALILSGSAKQLAGALAFHASKDKDVATAILMAAEIIRSMNTKKSSGFEA